MVGSAGAGKSTTGRELARILGVPFVELDSIYHQPDWVPLPVEEFRRQVAEVAAGDAWVVDGNYSAARPLVWARARDPRLSVTARAGVTARVSLAVLVRRQPARTAQR